MSNRIYIDTVHVRYLRKEPSPSRDSFGLFIWDDFDHFSLLDFVSEADIPDTLEKILRYCFDTRHSQVWDLFVQNADDGLSTCFDDVYFDAEELKALLDALVNEDAMEGENAG